MVGFWTSFLRIFRRECVVCCVNGGRILLVWWVGSVGLLSESSVGVVWGLCWQILFGGLGVDVWDVG